MAETAEFRYDEQWDPKEVVAAAPDLVLSVNDYPYDIVRCFDACRQAGIPTLILQDGILEWRCQYENPLFGAGGGAPQHQPVMADKIACLGAQSARQIAAWGNAAKVEVTGMPRLDHLLARPPVPVRRPGRSLLVMTAKNPGFTPAQREVTLTALREVQAVLNTLPELTVHWRVSGSVASALGVDNEMQTIASAELAMVVENVDAVITTPSTAMLETMFLGRPVAALDYHNVPRFVPTAWTISARDHIRPVVHELLEPAATKLAFQADGLADCLSIQTPAAPRVAALIVRMVESAKQTGLPLPAKLIAAGQSAPAAPELAELYGDAAVFRESDVRALQLRLARAENEMARLKQENAALHLPARIATSIRRFAGNRR